MFRGDRHGLGGRVAEGRSKAKRGCIAEALSGDMKEEGKEG
jgi:hypothetical protein